MEIFVKPEPDKWPEILGRPETDLAGLRDSVSSILEDVRSRGDAALAELTKRFDGLELDGIELPAEELEAASSLISEDLKQAIELARKNIERFHLCQKRDDCLITTTEGVRCWTRTVPIEKVGLYIPGGSAPLLSTVLMLGIPASLAGCEEIVLCTPPGKNGKIHPAILYCANLLGIRNVYRIGGAQAIAAMAYGTESIPGVHKIFGPGNQYVTVAKQLVSLQKTAIDIPAGPSEVAVIADDTSDPAYVAADLISQAEHGPDSQVLLITTDKDIPGKVQSALEEQLSSLPRRDIAERALSHSRMVVLETIDQVIELVNQYAPEHLIIMCRDYGEVGIRIRNAGSVFMGSLTPESAGDYASGTNHTLPTDGYARVYSGLALSDFEKRISFQEISEEGLKNIGPAIMTLAREEELEGHSRAVELRLKQIDSTY